MVRRHQAASPGHIVYNRGWVAWDVFADVARDHPCVGVKTTARRKSDDKADSLTCVEFIRSSSGYGPKKTQSNNDRYEQTDFLLHGIFLL